MDAVRTFIFDGQPFAVHGSVLETRLPYFAAATGGAFGEKKKKKKPVEVFGYANFHPDSPVKLFDLSAPGLTALVVWAYTDHLEPLWAHNSDPVYWQLVGEIVASSPLVAAMRRQRARQWVHAIVFWCLHFAQWLLFRFLPGIVPIVHDVVDFVSRIFSTIGLVLIVTGSLLIVAHVWTWDVTLPPPRPLLNIRMGPDAQQQSFALARDVLSMVNMSWTRWLDHSIAGAEEDNDATPFSILKHHCMPPNSTGMQMLCARSEAALYGRWRGDSIKRTMRDIMDMIVSIIAAPIEIAQQIAWLVLFPPPPPQWFGAPEKETSVS
jgi:hypothetical protein